VPVSGFLFRKVSREPQSGAKPLISRAVQSGSLKSSNSFTSTVLTFVCDFDLFQCLFLVQRASALHAFECSLGVGGQ
jgi:hypothetical protein